MLRAALLLCLALAPAPIHAQALQYDVITVKPHDPADTSMSVQMAQGTYSAKNIQLDNLIAGAYGVKMWLVTGLPGWARSASWDIEAKLLNPPPGRLKSEQYESLMKGLLRSRFGLQAYEEQRVQPVFEMTVSPGGPALHATAPGPPGEDGKPTAARGGYRTRPGSLEGSLPIATLCESLSYTLERTVIDKTGLTGLYDIALHWSDETDSTAGDNGQTEKAPALVQALQQQVGLKLTPTKAMVPAIVVDAIHQPDAN